MPVAQNNIIEKCKNMRLLETQENDLTEHQSSQYYISHIFRKILVLLRRRPEVSIVALLLIITTILLIGNITKSPEKILLGSWYSEPTSGPSKSSYLFYPDHTFVYFEGTDTSSVIIEKWSVGGVIVKMDL